ncbi:Predicted metal-dependent hydrolase of the TIM-barrel fold [Chlamydia abortus]|uniref:Amidohydrolase family protein n=1 Tax=Paenibacillus residui TaxID=629724 RepID=A0ABW3DCW3_9BACL|nr:amidohydrolase family protein [Paenibacillus sp. 32O-W]SHE13039.1 Predicted metal-dependent hydrolase of the TIM-barrel fold [Chlamydia abortus]
MAENYKVIDADVHNEQNDADLVPYLPEPWKSRVARSGVGYSYSGYYSPVGVMRRDSIPPGGGKAGSDPELMIKQLIEPYNVEYAILTGVVYNISTTHDPDFAAAICSAYNDYLIAEWLGKHRAFKGAAAVATQDPQLAAREIDRIGGHPDIVEVIISSAARSPLGQRQYHPIYEAAERNGLPVALHPGAEGAGGATAPTAAGYPTWYIEWHTCLSQMFMAHLVSMVCEGVFEKFPGLKVVLIEGGMAWLPHVMWRLDKNYKALRSQVPWLKKLPSQYIREHCYLTTQPIEEPDNPQHLVDLLNMVDAENMILYSSDYPHWDFDPPSAVLRKLSPDARRKVLYENAKQLYKL